MTCIALTGCTGFIGRRVLDRLRNAGYSLRLHARRPLAQPNATLITGDLAAPSTWRELLQGADAVIHLAGAVRGRNPRDFAINVSAVEALCTALQEQPTLRVVQVSSLAARQPQLSAYAESKRAGERVLMQARVGQWTILRPPAVYGPGDTELAPLLALWAKGFGVYPGNARARVSLLHVDDLCSALQCALHSPASVGKILEPDDGHAQGYRWVDVIKVVANVMAHPIRELPLPPLLLDAVAHAVVGVSSLLGIAPMLSPGKVRELCFDDWVSHGVADALPGWQPRVALREGLAEALAALLAARRPH